MREYHLEVSRTARYVTLGEPESARSLWYALHGFGQLAAPFSRHFEILADGTRLIVVPEALNRFYLEQTSWRGAGQARVGATWMTREDRLAEIADYVRYLDTLHRHVISTLGGRDLPVTVLGFSQGVATAVRWVCRGGVRPSSVILWAGPLPPELDRDSAAALRSPRLVRALGEEDEMAGAEIVAAEAELERRLGLSVEHVRFDGGHRIDAELLARIAAG